MLLIIILLTVIMDGTDLVYTLTVFLCILNYWIKYSADGILNFFLIFL